MTELGNIPGAHEEQEFAAWLQQGCLPQIKTGVQQRSVRTAYALVQSGFALLRSRGFDSLSIEEICAAADATPGAFYGRFEGKQAFFEVLQTITCLRSEAALAAFVERAQSRPYSLDKLCHMIVELTVDRYRANVGIFRAALQHADQGAWAPFRRLGDSYRRALTEILSPQLSHVPRAARAIRVQFAYQVIVGTLVHATLNDPGPLHLQDDALTRELAEMVLGYLTPRRVRG